MSLKINQSENQELLTVQIQKPSAKYFDEMLRMSSAADLLRSGVFPNAKEVTESFGAYDAVRRHLWRDFKPDDDEVLCICVADGRTPRTALTFALRSAWTCISVDPNLNTGRFPFWVTNFRRLLMFAKKIEQCQFSARKVVVVMVHPHVKIPLALEAITGFEQRAVVSMPCCVKQEIPGHPPDLEYHDRGVWSPQRTVKVWKQI